MQIVKSARSAWKQATSLLVRALAVESGNVRQAMDALEPRAMLANTPLPLLTDLENPNNAVVRIETNFGDIDIELFTSQAPITVANFLNYVTSGRYDETFFHRSVNSFVLQGGAFRYDNAAGFSVTPTDAAIIRESTGRSNVARTLAMARTNQINSATNQFFINYQANTNLDPTGPNDGYAVFGRVVQGWDNVLTISGLSIRDLTSDPAFAGDNSSAMGEVPVTSEYSQVTGVRENALVTIVNAEVVKPSNVSGFYSQRVVIPEGYRSSGTVETLDISNPNNGVATYQVIARYETGERDVVIASGSLGADSKTQIRLSDLTDVGLTLLRQDTPYSLVIESAVPDTVTSPLPVAAQVSRYDFGAATSETAFNTNGWSNTQLRTWTLPRFERNANSREFIAWQNLSSETAVITTTFFTSTGQVTDTRVLEAYRRGGLDIAALALPTGVMGVRITSTQNIAVMGSDFDTMSTTGVPPNGTAPYTASFAVMGIAGGGQNAGGIAGVSGRDGFTDTISIFNPGNTVAAVTLSFWTTDRAVGIDPIQRFEVVLANSRTDFVIDYGLLGIDNGEIVSVTYTSGAANVSLQYTSFPTAGRSTNVASALLRDGAAETFQYRASPRVTFAGGQLVGDGSGLNATNGEILSLFNPYGASNVTFTYSVRVTFSDGFAVDAFSGSLGANQRIDYNIASSPAVKLKAESASQFRNYTISVTGTAVNGATTTQVAPLALLVRGTIGTQNYIATSGMSSSLGIALNDPQFAAGNGG